MIAREANAEHRRLVDHIRIELDIAEFHRGALNADSARPIPGRRQSSPPDAQHLLADQQIVDEVEILGQASAARRSDLGSRSTTLADAPGMLCPSLARDLFRDRLPHRIGDAGSLRTSTASSSSACSAGSLKVIFLRAISVSRYHANSVPSTVVELAQSEGTLREHHREHARPPAVTLLSSIPPICGTFVVAASLA